MGHEAQNIFLRKPHLLPPFDAHAHTHALKLVCTKMQLLHTPSSSTLPFHFSNSQPRGRHERPALVSFRDIAWSSITTKAASVQASASAVSSQTAEIDVLKSLSQIIDPDFGTDIVSCGFVKDLNVNKALGEFEQKANEVVTALPWVKRVSVTMSARPAKPVYAGNLPENLQTISNIIAVSSCKVQLSRT
ncbi:Fe-S cluster assembly factor [Abeliophyllum distichum]|uniref:Fe-S cluster assembly factor n=1 Tax=Abeliophyllum distichum TaxID=126358 RepID=A0ABD1NNA8_9LAMI